MSVGAFILTVILLAVILLRNTLYAATLIRKYQSQWYQLCHYLTINYSIETKIEVVFADIFDIFNFISLNMFSFTRKVLFKIQPS